MFRALVHLTFRTNTGRLICLVVALLAVAVTIRVNRALKDRSVKQNALPIISPPTRIEYTRESHLSVITPPPPLTNAPAFATNIGTRFSSTNSNSAKRRQNHWAPVGLELPVALKASALTGIASAHVRGRVTEDCYYHEKLIIPKNAEIRGRLTGQAVGNRILTDNAWQIVFPSGFTMAVRAEATFRDALGKNREDALKEGATGLWGYRFQSLSAEEIRLFIYTFVNSFAVALQETRSTSYGNILKDSPKNAAASALSSIVSDSMAHLSAQVREQGFAILAPVGTPFWLDVDEELSVPPAAFLDHYQPQLP